MTDKSWLEVSLTVDGELAEAVAEVLARFAPGGVVVESTAIQAGPDEEGTPVGPLRVCAYLPADDQIEETRRKLEEALWFLGRIQPLPAPTFTPIQETNWMEAWKQHYRPVEVGEKLLILPAWIDPPDTERAILKIDPGMAFGTGTHPTTQLSLILLEKYIRPGEALLDIGCGSGILAVAGRKLGACAAYGVDIEVESVAISHQTAADNEVHADIDFALGSVAEVKGGAFPIRQAPLVVANILTHILIRLLDDGLAGLVAPGGVLLLSGILLEREPDLLAALQKHHLEIIERLQIDDWVGLALKAA